MGIDREKLDFLLLTFDLLLRDGLEPATAWSEALEQYAYVYHEKDGRLPINRAAELTLKRIKEKDGRNKQSEEDHE